jgi:hypothetical protein
MSNIIMKSRSVGFTTGFIVNDIDATPNDGRELRYSMKEENSMLTEEEMKAKKEQHRKTRNKRKARGVNSIAVNTAHKSTRPRSIKRKAARLEKSLAHLENMTAFYASLTDKTKKQQRQEQSIIYVRKPRVISRMVRHVQQIL